MRGFITALILIFLSVQGFAQGIAVSPKDKEKQKEGTFDKKAQKQLFTPIKGGKVPAAGLLDAGGATLTPEQVGDLADKGSDVSLLQPSNDFFWQNRKYAKNSADPEKSIFPDGEKGVRFIEKEGQFPHAYMGFLRVNVKSEEQPDLVYRMGFSLVANAVSARSTLLRKLGYYVIPPKYYEKMKLFFDNEDQKEKFLKNAKQRLFIYFETRKWILENNKEDHSLTFSHVLLETLTSDQPEWYWAMAPSADDDESGPYLTSRPYRAAILPFVLVDIPESINRFSAKSCSVAGGLTILNHPFADSFKQANYSDLRWGVRRLLTLSEADIQEIVDSTSYIECLKPLVYAKILLRMRNLAECFHLKSEYRLPVPDLKRINSPNTQLCSGLVVKGKVTKENLEGVPYRIAHGDRQSPIGKGDATGYVKVELKSSIVKSILEKFNEKLPSLTMTDAAESHIQDVKNNIADHIKNHPNEPLYQEIEGWGGPLYGFNLNVTRHITTGTFFQSTAPVQLVDNFSVSANAGYFYTFDGLKDYTSFTPLFTANVMKVRDYTHVRPIDQLKEGNLVPMEQMIVPHQMTKFASILDSELQNNALHPIDEFLANFKKGETFIISDSWTVAGSAGASSPITLLMGLQPLNFVNSVSFSADLSKVIMSQIVITKTEKGTIDIYVRDRSSLIAGISFDVNFYLNIFKLRAQKRLEDAETDAFLIRYSPDQKDEDNSDLGKARDDLKIALGALFKLGDTDYLYQKFNDRRYQISHELNTRHLSLRMLWTRLISFNECHSRSILMPANDDHPELDPKDEIIDLYNCRKGKLVGRDVLGMILDGIAAVLKNEKVEISLSKLDSMNPANTPFGKAKWKIVNVEKNISKQNVKVPESASIKYVWGGWSMKDVAFNKLIDQINEEFATTNLVEYRAIEKEAFNDMEKIIFYRITQKLSFFQKGLDKIRDLVLQPTKEGLGVDKARWLSRFFQWASSRGKKNKPRAGDKALFEEIMTIVGNGDYNLGKKVYEQNCRENYRTGRGGNSNQNGFWRAGTYYDCLTPWVDKLIRFAHIYPKTDKKKQTAWTLEVISVLEEQLPLPLIIKYIGEDGGILIPTVFGFRKGEEDGDLEYVGNMIGSPQTLEDLSVKDGVVKSISDETGISPLELDMSNGGIE